MKKTVTPTDADMATTIVKLSGRIPVGPANISVSLLDSRSFGGPPLNMNFLGGGAWPGFVFGNTWTMDVVRVTSLISGFTAWQATERALTCSWVRTGTTIFDVVTYAPATKHFIKRQPKTSQKFLPSAMILLWEQKYMRRIISHFLRHRFPTKTLFAYHWRIANTYRGWKTPTFCGFERYSTSPPAIRLLKRPFSAVQR